MPATVFWMDMTSVSRCSQPDMAVLICSVLPVQDRTVRSLLRDAGRIAVHPMNRNVAAIATEGPEGAPLGFRSGIPDTMTADEEQVGSHQV
jgi:hypothetical protein